MVPVVIVALFVLGGGLRIGRSPLPGQDNVVCEGTTIGVSRGMLCKRKAVTIARWSGVSVLDSGERGLERGLDHPRERRPVSTLRGSTKRGTDVSQET